MYNTSAGLAARAARLRARLILGTIVFFALFRIVLAGREDFLPLLSSWAADAFVFLTIYAAGQILRHLPAGRAISALLFHSAFLLYFVLSFSFCFFFREATVRQYSVLDLSPSSIFYFFSNVLPFWGFVLCAAALVILYSASAMMDHLHVPGRSIAVIFLGTFKLAKSTADQNASPILHLIHDVTEAFKSPGAVPDPVSPFPVESLDNWTHPAPELRTRYKKIILLVMEQVTLAQLREESAALPRESFFNREEQHSHEYLNVFAADMDSRTGMLAILGSRLIPFEAYNDEDVFNYQRVAKMRSLLDIVHAQNFRAVYAASETEREMVVLDLPWDGAHTLTHEEIDRVPRDKYICINPYEFEHSCEDKIMLDRMMAEILSREKVFLFYEFIFGHASEYMDIAKKTQVQYYAEFIGELSERLRRAGVLNDTLIVVTSDHGIRDHGYESWVSTYRIPLLFYHPSYRRQTHDELFSQIDFRDIFLDEASGRRPSSKPRKFAPFMGSTSSAVVGAVTDKMDVLVIKRRKWKPYVQSFLNRDEEGEPGGPPESDLTPGALLRHMDDYRDYFLSGQAP